MQFLTTPSTFLGVLIVVLSVFIAVVGLKVVRPRVSYSILKDNDAAAGSIYSMMVGVYAVLLAFIVVVVWQQYSETDHSIHKEALHISNLLRDSQIFPDETRDRLHERLITYTKAVMTDEWNTMSRGQLSPGATEAYEQVWQIYYQIQPQTEGEKVFYRESVVRLNEISSLRRLRFLSSRSGLPAAMWVLLIGGGIVTVAFTYLFAIKSEIFQTLMVASLAGLIGFILFLILALDFPFSGALRLEPTAFQSVIQTWEPK